MQKNFETIKETMTQIDIFKEAVLLKWDFELGTKKLILEDHYGVADLKLQGFKQSQYIIFGKYTSGMFQFGLSILKHGFN